MDHLNRAVHDFQALAAGVGQQPGQRVPQGPGLLGDPLVDPQMVLPGPHPGVDAVQLAGRVRFQVREHGDAVFLQAAQIA